MMAGRQEKNPVMRADEVRQFLKIGKNTLYLWCEQDIIPHKRIGRLIFFLREEILDFLKNKKEGGKQ